MNPYPVVCVCLGKSLTTIISFFFFFFFFLVVLVKIHTEYSIHLGYDIFGKFLPLKSGAFSWRNGMESDLAF